MQKSVNLHGLYVLTNESLTPPDQLLAAVAEAIAGGSRIIQYRDKSSSPATRMQQARQLRQLCNDTNTVLIINDDIALARDCHADGVHLGKDDAAIDEARAQLGAGRIIGVSCYNDLRRAIEAEQAGADYVAFGSFYASEIKPDAVQADLQLLEQAKEQLHIPIVAIGGISADNAAQLIGAGADMLAVISAVFAQADIVGISAECAAIEWLDHDVAGFDLSEDLLIGKYHAVRLRPLK